MSRSATLSAMPAGCVGLKAPCLARLRALVADALLAAAGLMVLLIHAFCLFCLFCLFSEK
jgi:hypothetical protein